VLSVTSRMLNSKVSTVIQRSIHFKRGFFMKITFKGLILVLILLSGNLILDCMGLCTDNQFKHEW
jgi:hypothetical protein